MMKYDFVNEVLKFNIDRNLDTQGFDPLREYGFVIEEVLEGFAANRHFESKKDFREFVKRTVGSFAKFAEGEAITPQDYADSLADILVFAVGGLLKLTVQHPELGSVDEVLKRVTVANSKKGGVVDADGKIVKGSDFVEPTH